MVFQAPLGPERSVSMTLDFRAEKAQKALFEGYDQLDLLWQEAEKQLARQHVPHPVDYQFGSYQFEGDEESEGCIMYEWLGLQKVKGKWRICYAELGELE